MAKIGTLTKQADGSFKGKIETLSFHANITMRLNDKPTENGPAFRVFSGYGEVGAGFEKTAQGTGQLYTSIKLDSPTFAAPIYVSAFPNREKADDLDLIWSRSKPE